MAPPGNQAANRENKPHPVARGVSSLLAGNLAMFASCERAAEGGKLSRVRSSQPLGSGMTGRQEPEGKRSVSSEVKCVCTESDT